MANRSNLPPVAEGDKGKKERGKKMKETYTEGKVEAEILNEAQEGKKGGKKARHTTD